MRATITNASHPRMAVFLCRALQRPARAAMPPGLLLIRWAPTGGVMGSGEILSARRTRYAGGTWGPAMRHLPATKCGLPPNGRAAGYLDASSLASDRGHRRERLRRRAHGAAAGR